MRRATMLARPLATWALMLGAALAAGGTIVAAPAPDPAPEALFASAGIHSPR